MSGIIEPLQKLPCPHYVRQAICSVEGLECLHSSHDLRKILISNLSVNLKGLLNFDVDSASSKELKVAVLWIDTVDRLFYSAEIAIDYCVRFLQRSNLQKLLSLDLEEKKDQNSLVKIIKDSAI